VKYYFCLDYTIDGLISLRSTVSGQEEIEDVEEESLRVTEEGQQ